MSREKITRGSEPPKYHLSPWKHKLQCKSLFNVADLVNGMLKHMSILNSVIYKSWCYFVLASVFVRIFLFFVE